MKMKTEAIESKSEFSKRINVSKSYVTRLVSDGLPLTPGGDVRVDAALKWIRSNVRAKPGRPVNSIEGGGADADSGDLLAAKTRLVIAQAERAELEIAARRRELVPAEEAKRAMRAATRTTRDMFINFAARYGGELAGEFELDPGTFIGALEAKIRTALNEAADTPPKFDDEDAV